jgi:hypothetical protein
VFGDGVLRLHRVGRGCGEVKSGLASIMKITPFSRTGQEYVSTAQVVELVLENHQDIIQYLSIALEWYVKNYTQHCHQHLSWGMMPEHNNPHPVYNKHRELLQSGNLRKIQHMVLTLLTGLLFLGQWHNTFEVTNRTARKMQEPNFSHDDCKKLANMRQVCHGAVGLCQ